MQDVTANTDFGDKKKNKKKFKKYKVYTWLLLGVKLGYGVSKSSQFSLSQLL